MRRIETSTLSNQSLATALLCHTYTADADRLIFVRVFGDQIAGNGDYVAYLTVQRLGAGSAYRVVPITTAAVASGVTAAMLTTIGVPVKSTDVVKVYLTGLAGDTTTPDIITEVWEDELHITVGAAGAGLTALPWNAAWDAEVQSEVADALAAADAIGAASISAAAAAKIADVVLRRTAANIEASASGDTLSIESLYGLIMAAFEASLSGTTLTIRKSDASTLGTKTVTVDASADPITGIT